MDTKRAVEMFVNPNGTRLNTQFSLLPINQKLERANREIVSAKPHSKAGKTARLRSSRAASKPERLVCRYCGSDDLAPSFKKRRDARCRACFKKRYGSTAQDKKAKRARKGKAKK